MDGQDEKQGTGTPPGVVPQSVRDELVSAENVEIEEQVLKVLLGRGGYANVDTLVIELWRTFGKKVERTRLRRRLKSLCTQRLLVGMKQPRSFFELTDTGRAVAAKLAGAAEPASSAAPLTQGQAG